MTSNKNFCRNVIDATPWLASNDKHLCFDNNNFHFIQKTFYTIQFYSILSHLAGNFWQETFGGKLLVGNFWWEIFGGKLLAGNFWRETLAGSLAENLWQETFGGKLLVGNFWRETFGGKVHGLNSANMTKLGLSFQL